MFAGRGISAQQIGRPVETVDIATTLSLLVGAKPPSGSTGSPLLEVLHLLIGRTKARFGYCLLLDCHSMPSAGKDKSGSRGRVDVVLGDCHGGACAPVVADTAAGVLKAMGYRVARNRPYAGGHVTRHYGAPAEGVHGLQVEINRDLYMDEGRIRPHEGMAGVTRDMRRLVASLGAIDARLLKV